MHLANLMKTNINVQQLTVEALRTKKKDDHLSCGYVRSTYFFFIKFRSN